MGANLETKSVNQQAGLILCVTLICLLILSGCASTKVLREPLAQETGQILAEASDSRLHVTLDWVVVRNGPGSWAKNADWDEYLLRIENLSSGPVSVSQIAIIDLLDARIEPGNTRKRLVKASKQNIKRYKSKKIRVEAGQGTGAMLATGAVVTAVGFGAAEVSAASAALSGGAAGGGGVAIASGLLLAGPALIIGGIVRGANNRAVDREIGRRRTSLPLDVASGGEVLLDLFYPIAPSPKYLEIKYVAGAGTGSLLVETHSALEDLHIGAREKSRSEYDRSRSFGPRNRR